MSYIYLFLMVFSIGVADLNAAGPKAYDPPKVCECAKCVCEDCKCGTQFVATDVKSKPAETPKTKGNKVSVKYLTYSEGVTAIEKDEKTVLITYVGIEPEAYPNVPDYKTFVVASQSNLTGYKKGDIVVSKFFNGKHEEVSLNGVKSQGVHNGEAAPVAVTYVRQCNGGTCSMVPVYSAQPTQPVQSTPLQYYFPNVGGSCPTGTCPNR